MKESFYNHNSSIEWGSQGHQLIAESAEELLSEVALNRVKKILQPLGKIGLRNIATWADIIKNSVPKDQDSKDFVTAFPDRGRDWHFVNLPLGAKSYDRVLYPDFTRVDDVVQMISASISILLGNPGKMSEVNALRWLTHLMGDIHQPIHVACGYIDPRSPKPSLVSDPDFIKRNNLKSDRGGNFIVLSVAGEKEVNLHSYWDGMLGFKEVSTAEPDDHVFTEEDIKKAHSIVSAIKTSQASGFSDEGNEGRQILDWPAVWASESLLKAREAYQSIEIEEALQGGKFRVGWEGKQAYETRCIPIVEQQLQSAAKRLAEVLNSIFR